MTYRNRRSRRAVGVAVVMIVLSVGLFAGRAGGQTGPAPGVTDKAVKLGFISSATGVASSVGKGAAEACKARIGRANAAGGVSGRKIAVEYIDDQSSPANLTAAEDLVENQKVFSVINSSALAFFSYRYLLGEGVPVIGGGFDGSYYVEPGNESIISGLGTAAVPGISADFASRMMKKLGATKVASVGYGISPASSETAKAFHDYAVPAVGLKAVYLNNTLEFGSTDVGPVVLGIKNSGADAVFLPLNADTNLAIVQGLQQNGVDIKANILSTGYGQELLDQPVSQILTPHDVMLTSFRPVELGGKGVKQFMADRKKYAGLTGVPDFGEYVGYVVCDIAIRGLEGAGTNLTRQGFVDAIRSPEPYDGAGLTCVPYDFSYERYGKLPLDGCVWFVAVKDGKFVVLNGGKPVTGKIAGDPKLLAQYAGGSGGSASPTTTVGK